MATLSSQNISRVSGVVPSYAAAAAGGDDFLPSRQTFLHVKNASAGALTVTVATPGSIPGASFGLPLADSVTSVPAAGERIVGPFPPELFADPADGLAKITYSGVTSLTVGCFRLTMP